jgi:hypothetical protein
VAGGVQRRLRLAQLVQDGAKYVTLRSVERLSSGRNRTSVHNVQLSAAPEGAASDVPGMSLIPMGRPDVHQYQTNRGLGRPDRRVGWWAWEFGIQYFFISENIVDFQVVNLLNSQREAAGHSVPMDGPMDGPAAAPTAATASPAPKSVAPPGTEVRCTQHRRHALVPLLPPVSPPGLGPSAALSWARTVIQRTDASLASCADTTDTDESLDADDWGL